MAATIELGTNSWVTEAEADAYMAERLGAGDYWTDGGADNIPAVITAYRWLTGSGRYSFPTTATTIMKQSQCEMALFLLQNSPDIDLRMGLQAQYVVEAGVVKEKYRTPTGIPVPPTVDRILRAYLAETPFAIFDIERDEERTTSYNAPGNLERDD